MDLLSAKTLDALKGIVGLQLQAGADGIAQTGDELQAAKDAQKDAAGELEDAKARVAEATSQISRWEEHDG